MAVSVHGNAVLSVTEVGMLKNAGVLEYKINIELADCGLGQHLVGRRYSVPEKELEVLAESLDAQGKICLCCHSAPANR
jgi:hypothetical protein